MTVSPSTNPFTPISARKRRAVSPKKKASAQRRNSAGRRKHRTGKNQAPPKDVAKQPKECAPSPQAPLPSPIDSSVIILDWDDTLLASTHLASLGYRLEIEQEFEPYLQQQLNKLEGQVVSVLEKLIACSGRDASGKATNLVIITNAERGWVELSAKKFIPGVLPTLEKCHVVSARSTFEVSGSGPFEWKLLAFYHKIQQAFGFRIAPPALHPESPYAGYLQRLFEAPEHPTYTPAELPYELERDAGFNALPGLDDFEDATTDSEEDPVSKPVQAEASGKPLAGGGTASVDPFSKEDDKENPRSASKASRPPRAMLLDEQNAYCQEETVLIENGASAPGGKRPVEPAAPACEQEPAPVDPYHDDPISPYHLYDAGLSFKLSPDHEELERSEKYVVSFGDSLAEKHAAYNVVQNMPNTILKTVKFLERPTISQLCKQLTLMELNLDYILETRRPMDLVLNPNPE